MIEKYVKFAPFLIGIGIVVAIFLLATGNHFVEYESSTRCSAASCPDTRWRLSIPFIFAIVAVVDGIALLVFKNVRKNMPATNNSTSSQPSYDPNTGGFNTPTSGHYDPNNPSAYDPNTPNK